MSDALQNFIPFLLYRVVAKAVSLASAEYAEMGLSIPEARVLIVVMNNPGIRAGKLAELTCIEQSALSHLLRRMSRKKILTRQRVEEDYRSVQIGLTVEGWRLAKACYTHGISHENILLRNIAPSQATLLRSLLRQMYENAESWPSEIEPNSARSRPNTKKKQFDRLIGGEMSEARDSSRPLPRPKRKIAKP